MNEPAHLAALKRRIAWVIGVDAVCVLVAAACIYGFLSRHIAWMGAGFAVAMITGFIAQLWLVIRFIQDRPPR